jgi:hypothetical protein
MGKVIDGADPATFRVLNAAFEYSADAGRAVTGCTESAVSFTQ